MFKRISLLAVLAMVMLLVLAACGDATSTAPAATTTASAATTAAAGNTSTDLGKDICPNPGTTTWTGEVKIGLMGPFTGPSASLGLAIQRGATIAIEEINACGGINGKKLIAVERDDQAKADIGKVNVEELTGSKDIAGLVGTANTAVGVVQAPVVNQAKVPWVITVTTGTKVTQDTTSTPSYLFRVSMVDSEQTPFVAETVLSKYKKVALINDDSSYGQLGKDDVLKVFTAKGVTPLLVEPYKVGGTADDMKPMLNKVKASGAEVIISWGLGAENANIRKAMKDLNIDLPVYGSWGLSMPVYQTNAGGLEEGTVVPQTISIDTTNPKQLKFFDTYKKKYNTETVGFPSGLGQSYDGTWIMAIALRQPGAPESRDKLREALENFGTYNGLVKTYTSPFKNQYHEAFTKADFFFTVWKSGKMVKLDTK